MAVTLDSSISWINATGDDLVMLENLQPNILKPHVRDALIILFLTFSDAIKSKTFLHDLALLMKSAKQHLEEVKAHNDDPSVLGSVYVGVGLTAAGYAALEVEAIPADASFIGGMQSARRLKDPDVTGWDIAFRDKDKLHAVILIGDSSEKSVFETQSVIEKIMKNTGGVERLGEVQKGIGLQNSVGEGIEHFGYVDGRSQPLFFKEDIEKELEGLIAPPKWDPDFPLGLAIVSDVAAPDPSIHFGSYFVFRKLEQDVRAFKLAELAFAQKLNIPDKERAGGMLVGRFEDGTPVTSFQSEQGLEPVPNDFSYASDLDGGSCPFLGHIRKTNPRGSGGKEPEESERLHLMPRRGQTYGVRTKDEINDGDPETKPSKEVGLLFMAFNSDIGSQFEFTQINWANGVAFPDVPEGHPAPGVDPIIGQTGDRPRPPMTCPVTWGDASTIKTVEAFPQTVFMKGGEYFFMPSLAFLRAL